MVDLNSIPQIERAELMKAIAEPVREYYRDPVNAEKFQAWLDKKSL